MRPPILATSRAIPHAGRARAAKHRRRQWGAWRRLVVFGFAICVLPLLAGPTDSQPIETATTPVAAVNPYNFPFTVGTPAAPTPWNPSTWDIAVHIRNNYQFGGLDAMQAQHGADCSAPPATHPVSNYNDAVFVCKNHIMTAMSAGGYGVIYLTPDHMFDWSGGTASLSFPVSTFRSSDRDWIDLWITPFGENLELPLESWLPDLQGPPKDAIHIRMDQFNQGTIFTGEIYSNFQSQALPNNWWTTLESVMASSAATRSTFELDLSQSHLRFGIPLLATGGSMYWIDSGVSVPFTRGVVQLGHHSYTPDKSAGCGPPPEQKALGLGCQPNTWHWGGLSMSSAVPFSLTRANDRVVSTATTTSTTFPLAAPAGSFLRFDGIGSLQVSFDGGKTWAAPTTQQESKHASDHFENFWMAVPQGTSRVMFKGQDWYGGPWFARDLSIWSLNSAGQPAPAPSPAPPSPSPSPSTSPMPSPVPTPSTGPPMASPTPTTSPGPTSGGKVAGGINAEPSMRPWRYGGPNPDGWWCQPPNCAQNSDPMVTVSNELALASRLGVVNVRLEFPWALIETSKGVFDWSRADAIVASAQSHGVTLQPVLVFSPSWAASDPTQAPAAADFKAFAQAIVARYKATIHVWEMWNEPDHFHYWNAGEAAYVANIVIPGFQGARAADPTAKVILAGTSVWNGSWFSTVFADGGGSSFDIVAYHDYGGSPQGTASNVRSAELAHGGTWPIWLGEYGVQETSVTDTQQESLMTAVLTSTAPLAVAQWYNLRDDYSMTCCPAAIAVSASWGVVMHNDSTMKDGFAMMQALLAAPGSTPSPSPSASPTPSASPSPGSSPSPGPAPSPTPRSTETPRPPSPSPSPSPSGDSAPSPSPTPRR